MRLGLAGLVAAYMLSQFYRACLAVLAPALSDSIGATAGDLARASGYWFLVFAAMQIPVGAALDRIGPRRTAAVLLAIGGGGGALVFAVAQVPGHVSLAMALIGLGCSPVLMAAYFIFARVYPVRLFATLGAATIGIGSIGNIAGSLPMSLAVEAFGWRQTMAGIAVLTLAVAALLWLTVRDPDRVTSDRSGSILDLLRIRALWPIFALLAVNYAAAAGLRGLWAGPYAAEVFQADAAAIGWLTLVMGLAMIAGNFIYGPLDRVFGTRKWVAFHGNAVGLLACLALAVWPASGLGFSVLLFALIGASGASFAVLMAHAKAFVPAHLTGRGVTLANLFGIGGVGIIQTASGGVFAAASARSPDAAGAYQILFGFFALLLGAGLVAYLFSRDRAD